MYFNKSTNNLQCHLLAYATGKYFDNQNTIFEFLEETLEPDLKLREILFGRCCFQNQNKRSIVVVFI